ncbi:MAG: hypothetical protein JWO78_1236 [Micavibrio sp.]|nr:hypothetical protein [Micavibrio sp.]
MLQGSSRTRRKSPEQFSGCRSTATRLTTPISIPLRIKNYKHGDTITIDVIALNGMKYYLDNTPSTFMSPSARARARTQQALASQTGNVDSVVIVLVDHTGIKGTQTEISGEIFYIDPRLKGLPPARCATPLRTKPKLPC